MECDRIGQLRRNAILEAVMNKSVPVGFSRATKELEFTDLNQFLLESVMKIELTARPSYWRPLELIMACGSAALSSMTGSALRNFTIGKLQIGILTSLQWTRTPITVLNYLKRMLFLFSINGSCRIFGIGIHLFWKIHKRGSEHFANEFAEFYNGKQRSIPELVTYGELLDLLMPDNALNYQSSWLVNSDPGTLIERDQMSICTHKSLLYPVDKIDDVFESRLDRIRNSILDGDALCASLILCSKSRQQIVFSRSYGKLNGALPVIETPRTIASTMKLAVYTAFLENHPESVSATFDDRPLIFRWRDKWMEPRNADGKFRGKVTLEYAFANSINLIAVQLILELGIDAIVKYLRNCGVYCPLPNTPILALGPIKLTGFQLLGILSPILYDGHLVYLSHDKNERPSNNGKRIISSSTAQTMMKFLKATVEIGTGKYIKTHCAEVFGGKTGTSEGNTDLWFVGIVSNDLYGLVWLGREDEKAIYSVDHFSPSAARFAVPLWSDLIELGSDAVR